MTNLKTTNQAFLENTLLLENIQGGIVYSDFEPPFCLRYATEGMCNLSGYSLSELLQLKQMDIVHPDDEKLLTRDVGNQLSKGDVFEVEYRLKKKDGSYVDVLDRAKVVTHDDGNKYIHCLLTDVSDIKKMEKEIKLSQEKLKIAIFQSGNVIFELDPLTQVVKFSENFESVFEQKIPDGRLDDIISEWAHDHYKAVIYELLAKAISSMDSQSEEIKIKNIVRGEIWAEINITSVRNERNEVFAVLGSLKNIDAQRRKMDELIDLSQKDSLTDIYNRSTMEIRVNEKLPEQGALIILDIDFFKQINDKNGHAYGDDILIKLARTIEKVLPMNALFGRLGGDEFLIYINHIVSSNDLEIFLNTIMQQVRTITLSDGSCATVSLGAALVDENTTTFDGLYRKADIALYKSKDKGRNCYSVL